MDTVARIVVHPPEPAWQEHPDGTKEAGAYFFVEKTLSAGILRASYEYTIYYWPESQTWDGDVISPYGWFDIDEDELPQLIEEFGLRPVEPSVLAQT